MRAAARFAFAAVVVTFVVTVAGSSGSANQNRSADTQTPDARTVVHVLNRLGFGAAPGDVERVRAMGLAHYIDEQLQPARIDDSATIARLTAFETLSKSTAEMARDYYVPAQTIRRDLQRQQAAQEPPANDAAMTAPEKDAAAKKNGVREMMTPEQMEIVRKEREALGELSRPKILRAAYSERQLEEVMVDFWFNHFNVFAGKGADARSTDRVRARRDPSARARQVPRSARGDGAEPGDALLSRQLAERGARRRDHVGAAEQRRPSPIRQPDRCRAAAVVSDSRTSGAAGTPRRRTATRGSTRTTPAS